MKRATSAGSLQLEGGTLVLTSHEDLARGESNLWLADEMGNRKWTAQVYDKRFGFFVSVETDGTRIFANTYDCYRVELDPENGSVLARDFTK